MSLKKFFIISFDLQKLAWNGNKVLGNLQELQSPGKVFYRRIFLEGVGYFFNIG